MDISRIDSERCVEEFGLRRSELAVLVAVITYYRNTGLPVRRREVVDFMMDKGCGAAARKALTRLVSVDLLRVVRSNSGGEHLVEHTERAERRIGVAMPRQEFLLAVGAES